VMEQFQDWCNGYQMAPCSHGFPAKGVCCRVEWEAALQGVRHAKLILKLL
jgi:hypothetical protein